MGGLERLHPAPGLLAFAGRGVRVGDHGPAPGELPFELRQLLAEALRLVVLFGAAADAVIAPACRADEVLVASHEGRGHRAGGDDECLGFEGAEQEGEGERDDDRFDRLPAEGERADDHVPGAELGGGRNDRGVAGLGSGWPGLVDGHARAPDGWDRATRRLFLRQGAGQAVPAGEHRQTPHEDTSAAHSARRAPTASLTSS